MSWFLLRTAYQTLRRSSTSCSSSSRPPCSQSASLRFSPITAGSSARTDPLLVGGVQYLMTVCVYLHCVLSVDAVFIHPAISYLCILNICSQSAPCLCSVIFALMMKDVSLGFSHHQSPSSSVQWFEEPLWASIRRSGFSLCVHSGTLCLCVEESGLSRGVCYSVMQRHKAQRSKQLSNRHCHAAQEEKSHLVAHAEICFSCTTKTLSFDVVLLPPLFSKNRSCVDLLCD